ncbi:hypothetical protein [Actinomadura sp. 3N407]|uniref:hypothetical protein n=1 Tax=Actinomadura sp. 3N407 TaxID=3457423 RepID=UPI003FCD3989
MAAIVPHGGRHRVRLPIPANPWAEAFTQSTLYATASTHGLVSIAASVAGVPAISAG